LRLAAAADHVTVATIVERGLWKYLGNQAARKGAQLFQRLLYADALICDVLGNSVAIAGTRPANVHQKEPRPLIRNELSEKVKAAFDEVYEIAQTEALAEANEARAGMYELLAHLAQVNRSILKDASEEEILDELEKVREDQLKFEEATRKLEAEAKESAATK
jgi:hypothetical protein